MTNKPTAAGITVLIEVTGKRSGVNFVKCEQFNQKK